MHKLIETAKEQLGAESTSFEEIEHIQSFIKRYLLKSKKCREYKQNFLKEKETNKELEESIEGLNRVTTLLKTKLAANHIDFREICENDPNSDFNSEGEAGSEKKKRGPDESLALERRQVKYESKYKYYKQQYQVISDYAHTLEKNLNFLRSCAPFAGLMSAKDYIEAVNRCCVQKAGRVGRLETRVERQKKVIRRLREAIYRHVDEKVKTIVTDAVKGKGSEDEEAELLTRIEHSESATMPNNKDSKYSRLPIVGEGPGAARQSWLVTKVLRNNVELRRRLKRAAAELERLKTKDAVIAQSHKRPPVPQPQEKPSCSAPATITLTGLVAGVGEDKLRSFFARCGAVKSVKAEREDCTRIEFETEASAKRALDLDGRRLDGKRLHIQPGLGIIKKRLVKQREQMRKRKKLDDGQEEQKGEANNNDREGEGKRKVGRPKKVEDIISSGFGREKQGECKPEDKPGCDDKVEA